MAILVEREVLNRAVRQSMKQESDITFRLADALQKDMLALWYFAASFAFEDAEIIIDFDNAV